MKTTGNILLAVIILFLSGCLVTPEETEIPVKPETHGAMEIEIIDQAGVPTDKMETVRIFVFKNAYGSPLFELNEQFPLPPISSGEEEISKFRLTLEVDRKITGGNDKIVVAVVNEPASMKTSLDAIDNYNQLMDMQLDLALFLTPEHNGLQNGKTMPMAGISRTDKVYPTLEEAKNDPVKISIVRATARVDVYLRKEAGLDFDLAAGTTITLNRTYDKEYFIRCESGSNVFGKIQTVTSGFLSKSRTITDADDKEIPTVSNNNTNGRLLCSFHTAERTCTASGNSDKLLLDIHIITSEGTTRNTEIMIDKLFMDETEKDINRILRNNLYEIIITVGSDSITAIVLDWNDEELPVEL